VDDGRHLGKRKVLYKIVGFNRAMRPCAARSCLFRLINAQKRALRHFYDESKARPLSYVDQQLNYRNSPEFNKGLHCKENPINGFLFWELRGLSPNINIHVSVSHSYISRIGSHISLHQNRQTDPGNI
jgi:hypothetical protein